MTEIALPTPQRRRGRLADTVSTLAWVLSIILLACQVAIWLQPSSPRLAVLEQFAVQLSGVAFLGGILAVIARRWAVALLLAVLVATFAWPVLAARPAALTVVGPDRLTVLSANLWARAGDHQRTLDLLMSSEADIIGLVEVSPAWRNALAPLIAKYPYHADCFAVEPACQTLLLSKLPIVRPQGGRIWRTTPIVAGGEVSWNGRRFTVLAVHLTRPLSARWSDDPKRIALPGFIPANRQAEQADTLARYLNTLPPDALVMGDFNAAPWSRVQRAFRAVTGLGSEAGWAMTWPAGLPSALRLSLDHVLARGRLVVTRFDVGPQTDSDHLPVIAEIGWSD